MTWSGLAQLLGAEHVALWFKIALKHGKREDLIIIMIVFQIIKGKNDWRHSAFFATDSFVEIDQLVARISRTINLVKVRHYK